MTMTVVYHVTRDGRRYRVTFTREGSKLWRAHAGGCGFALEWPAHVGRMPSITRAERFARALETELIRSHRITKRGRVPNIFK